MFHRRSTLLALLVAAAVACGDDPTGAGIPVVHVAVTPADTVLAPGDSAAFAAVATGTSGEPLPTLDFAWTSSDTTRVRVGQDGRATAVAAGVAVIEARAENGVRGFARVEVRHVAALEPSHGAFGSVVRLAGSGFGTEPRVLFGGGVEGFLLGAAADGRSLEAWVPLGAESGPVSVVAGVDTFPSAASFYVTGGGEDALEPNGYDAPLDIVLPFHNPALVVRPVVEAADADLFRFTLAQPSPISLRLTDRSDALSLGRATRFELFDVGRQDIVGLAASVGARGGPFDFDAVPLLPVEIGVAELPAGTYQVLVTPFSFTGSLLAAGERGYGLRIDASPAWTLPPDAAEPNDTPAMAPVLPFPSTHQLALENAWSADYFLFDVATPADVSVEVFPLTTEQSRLRLWLMSAPAKSIPWIDVTGDFPDLFMPALVSAGRIQVGSPLDPGRYVVAVLDGIGAPTPYRLELRQGLRSPPAGVANGSAGGEFPHLRSSMFPEP